MATYCFVERKKELFFEAITRGFAAGVHDWPHLTKTEGDARAAAEELRPEVCCVSAETDPVYQRMIAAAWLAGYGCLSQCSEREVIGWYFAADIRGAPTAELLRIARKAVADKAEVRDIFNDAYRQYVEAIAKL